MPLSNTLKLLFAVSLCLTWATWGLAQEPITLVPSQAELAKDELLTAKIILQQKLDQRITVSFLEAPLNEVVDALREKAQIDIRIDLRGLDDAGLSSDVPVTIHLKNVRFETALHFILRSLDLTWYPYTEHLLITTYEDCHGIETSVYYPLSDLLTNETNPQSIYDSLFEGITTVLEPEAWEKLGGPGTITKFEQGMVVWQTEDIHEQITELLAVIKKVKQLPNNQYDVTSIDIKPMSPQVIATRKKLREKVKDIQFEKTPLREAMETLLGENNLTYHIDENAIDDIGLTVDDIQLTGKWNHSSIESVLYILLSDYDLTFTLYDHVVVITNPEETDWKMLTKVYPVRDLLQPGDLESWAKYVNSYRKNSDTQHARLPYYDALMEVIQANIESYSWEEVGGNGAIFEFHLANCLVISQSREIHEQIERYLAKIRLDRKRKPVDTRDLHKTVPPITHAYDSLILFSGNYIYSDSKPPKPKEIRKRLKEISGLIQKEIAPESWQEEAHYVKVVADRLVIKQDPHIHIEIQNYLIQHGLLEARVPSYFQEQAGPKKFGEQSKAKWTPAETTSGGGFF
ncbi:MAG: hypothetical protein COA78_02340 [Blastopirellula sp.]|nr:MAG: hypothetical protein COA78_02340 [Blastopirellula sp.]